MIDLVVLLLLIGLPLAPVVFIILCVRRRSSR